MTKRLLYLPICGSLALSACATPARQLALLPPSDPIESAQFAANYPKGRWMYGVPLAGLNIGPCDNEVCVAALNATPFFIMIRTESDKGHSELTIVVQNCVIDSAIYTNLPTDADELGKTMRSLVAQNVSFVARDCKTRPPSVPKIDTSLLAKAAQ
jgi:hypothetical protein